MSRIRFCVVGFCFALAACGDKFVANTGAAGSAGMSSAGHAGAGHAGAGHAGAGHAGAGHAGAGLAGGANEAGAGGSAGHDDSDAGEAGAGIETGGGGGQQALGGTGGLLGHAGGGSSGTAGSAGTIDEAMLPRAGLLVWLRADRGVQQMDGLVQGWLDQSGNQANATQLSSNTRPTYSATGFNGRPTLEFDGEGQFLSFAEGFGDFSKGLAAFIVAKPSKSDCASMVELSNGSEIDDIAFGMWQNEWTYEVSEPLVQSGKINLEAFSLYAVNHHPAGSADLRINHNLLKGQDMPLPASVVRVNDFIGHTLYGGCEYFRGQISEIILYSRALTLPELNLIEKYLDAHWALSEQGLPTPTP